MNQEILQQIRKTAFSYMENIANSGHDITHVKRVESNVHLLIDGYNLNKDILYIATWFHDTGRNEELKTGISHEIISARIAEEELSKIKVPKVNIDLINYCIKSHRYSSGIRPLTIEAKILQDADRLDALGAIGLARLFAHNNKRKIYHEEDPFYEIQRELEENKYTLDHYFKKIGKLEETLNTDKARKIARERIKFHGVFLKQLRGELNGEK